MYKYGKSIEKQPYLHYEVKKSGIYNFCIFIRDSKGNRLDKTANSVKI